uniref:KH homology domain-containing protein 4 n=2 Tax=Lygus hesperus TaxID=30085 RepID=A0A0A9W7A1_LYGHE
MNNPKFREKVLIGLENAPPTFNVRGKVVGPNGANLQYITNETGAIVTIRGRGSGYIEPNTGQESLEPLHICIEHSKYDVLQAGRQLAFNLIDTVQQEWANLQHQMQQDQQQQQQPPSVVSSSSNGPTQTIVANDGPQVVTSVAPPSSVALPTGFTQQAVGQMITVPPPSHVTLPPPALHIPSQMAPPQVATSTNNGALIGQANEGNQALVPAGGPSAGQEVSVSQASAQPPSINIPAQQQLFLSNQGTIIQPQTIIPQQQQIITPTGQVISAQPQVLAQSYLLQTNSGQMVFSYPNMVRPANTVGDASRGQQFMLVQYGDGGAIKTSAVRAPAPQPQTVPQMVQIINPQTGQIQHVLQHIQPQVQMQQLQAHLQPQLVGQGGGLLGQQVLMPIQSPIQFTSQPQQMIITQPPPQLQQHQLLPSGQTLQHVIPTSTLNQVTTPVSINVSQKQIVLNIAKQQQQGLKRRYEGDQQPQHFSIMDAQTSQQLHAKKGIGNVWLVSTADGTPGLAQTVCSPAYRYPAAVSEALLIQSGDLSLHNTQITKAEGMQRPSPAPQQDIIVQSGEKNQYGQDDWRRNSPLLTENPDARGDPNGLDPIKRGRMTQNGQGSEVGSDTRNEPGVERFPVKVEGGQHTQPPPQIYNVAAVPQQQQGIGVQRQQQPMQQIYQPGNMPQQAGPPQQSQVPGGPPPGQLPPGSYAQQMYPPPPLPSSTQAAPQQYVAPPIYNAMPPQQSYAAAPYNPWIMPS